MPLKRITLSLLISSFFLTSNFDCTATFIPSAEEEGETPQYSLHNSINISCKDLLKPSEIHTQESGLHEQIQYQSLRASFPLNTLADLSTKGKALIVLSLLPMVQAETPQAETIATNFYGTVLPTIIGASVLSAIIGPTIKDCMYRSYNKLMSSEFDRLHDFIDTTLVLRWPHESLRWGYFALLRGNRDVGDKSLLLKTLLPIGGALFMNGAPLNPILLN
ncbi:hypothetical protein IM40_07995 [Candidatus Paracaedimonas acanthamoebae]|nr:hypothetical protein IM40_07995 [Candidatus Paracaedimonas acanthamoebae]